MSRNVIGIESTPAQIGRDERSADEARCDRRCGR